MLSGIDTVKASNFCFIFANKFFKVPENHRIILQEEAQAESTCAVMRTVRTAAGWMAGDKLYN